MNSENNKTSKSHVVIFKLTEKLDFRSGEKNIALSSLSVCYIWENRESSSNNRFKIAPTWNNKFELPDEQYSIADIRDFSEYIKKKNIEKRLIILQ